MSRFALVCLAAGLFNSPLAAQDVDKTLLAQEKKVLEAIKTKNKKVLKELLGEQAYAVTVHDGRRAADANLSFLDGVTIEEQSLSDVKAVAVSKDVAILTYVYKWKGTFKGKAHEAKPVYATSVWARREGKWKSIFYQETPIKAK